MTKLANTSRKHAYIILTPLKKVREKSRECHNHKPQPFPDPKRKTKPTNLNKHKPNKRTKSTKISLLFPKRYIVKLGFTGVYIFFYFCSKTIDCGYSLEPPSRGLCSQIRVFVGHYVGSQLSTASSGGKRRLIIQRGCAV